LDWLDDELTWLRTRDDYSTMFAKKYQNNKFENWKVSMIFIDNTPIQDGDPPPKLCIYSYYFSFTQPFLTSF